MMKKSDFLVLILGVLVIIGMYLVGTNKIIIFDNYIYNLVIRNDLLTSIFKFITNFGSTLYIICICIILLFTYKPKNNLFLLYGVIIISTIINNVIKLIFRRARPLLMATLNLVQENTYSFPSGHAMASTTFYGFLIYLLWKSKQTKKIKIIGTILLSLLIIGICFSRIYLGAHYPSDVLIGSMCSIILLYIFIRVIEKRKKVLE